MKLLYSVRYLLTPLLFITPLIARDVILEFKGAYFLPTDCEFKKIYDKGSALFGPELTVQICNDRNIYAFTSIDYFKKKGHSVGLCNPTTVKLIPIALGLKYLFPTRDWVSLYVGLGLEAVNVRTENCSPYVEMNTSQWGVGGIAKVGAYYYLPRNFVIDMFVDYSFVRVGSDDCECSKITGIESIKANVSGAIFGLGLGYNF